MRDTVNNSLPQVMPIIALLNSHSAAQLKLTLTPEQAQYLVGEFQRLNAKLRRPHPADEGSET